MVKRKRRKDNLTNVALATIGTTVAISILPNLSGTPAESNIKAKSVEGIGIVGSTLPTVGKIVGTTLVFGALGKLRKKSKKLVRGSI